MLGKQFDLLDKVYGTSSTPGYESWGFTMALNTPMSTDHKATCPTIHGVNIYADMSKQIHKGTIPKLRPEKMFMNVIASFRDRTAATEATEATEATATATGGHISVAAPGL